MPVEYPVKVEVYRSFDELSPMQEAWDDFIESLNAEIFLSYDWCRIWWKFYGKGRELWIFLFRENDRLVGIMPLFVEGYGINPLRLNVVKIVGTDYLPVAISLPIVSDCLEKVIRAFDSEINSRVSWDMIYLGAISGKYNDAEKIETVFRNADGHYRLWKKSGDVQTYFKIAENWDQQLAGLKKQQRKNVNHAYRSIQNLGKTLKVDYATEDNLQQYYDEFVTLHQQAWREEGSAGHFADWPSSYDFHREVASILLKRGRLRLMKIALDETCLGYKYGYKFGDFYYQYLTARNHTDECSDIGFNQISFGEQVKKAVEEKVKYMDSMRGAYPHKTYLGGQLLPIKNLFICKRNVLSRARAGVFRSYATILDACYNKIWRRRATRWFGITPGTFRKIWITSHSLAQ